MEESNEQVEKLSLKRNLEGLTAISETMYSLFSANVGISENLAACLFSFYFKHSCEVVSLCVM